MIRIEGVSKILGGTEVIKNLDIAIRERETLALIGASGAGKSVALKLMIGILTPDSGRVLVGGEDISHARGRELEKLRRRFGVLFQGGALLEWLTVGENVALPLREKTKMANDEIMGLVMEKLELVGLDKDAEKFPSEISGGMRKRAGLARAIVTSPDIILYDEPTSGLDPVSSRTIDALINDMRTKLGVTSVVVTHDMISALDVGTRIAMLSDGEIIEDGAPNEFVESSRDEVQAFLTAQKVCPPDGVGSASPIESERTSG